MTTSRSCTYHGAESFNFCIKMQFLWLLPLLANSILCTTILSHRSRIARSDQSISSKYVPQGTNHADMMAPDVMIRWLTYLESLSTLPLRQAPETSPVLQIHETNFQVTFASPGVVLINSTSIMHTIVDAYGGLFFRALSQGTDTTVPGNQYKHIQDGALIELERVGTPHFWSNPLRTNQVGAALSALGHFYQKYNVEINFTVLQGKTAVAQGRVVNDSGTASA